MIGRIRIHEFWIRQSDIDPTRSGSTALLQMTIATSLGKQEWYNSVYSTAKIDKNHLAVLKTHDEQLFIAYFY